jgi:hypothetical protein
MSGGHGHVEHGGNKGIALLIDPLTAGTVYAGAYALGVFKTTDAGATWTRIPGSDRLHPDITSLALERGGPSSLGVVRRAIDSIPSVSSDVVPDQL